MATYPRSTHVAMMVVYESRVLVLLQVVGWRWKTGRFESIHPNVRGLFEEPPYDRKYSSEC
jgi:hypothetical protein